MIITNTLQFSFLFIALQICKISSSVLDINEDCRRCMVEQDVCISPASPAITKQWFARSDIECLMSCRATSGCYSVFRDTKGTCYELSSSEVDQVERGTGVLTGSHVKLIYTSNGESCATYNCSGEEVCFKGCGSLTLDDFFCMADERDTCEQLQEYTNARHYWTPIISQNQHSGAMMIVTYPKQRHMSGVRVQLHMTVRAHYQQAVSCDHWYLTFNGSKCTNPDTIEQLDYSATDGNYHRAMDIDGTCYGLAKGNLLIELVVQVCEGYSSGNPHTGWNSARTMVIMEVIPQQTSAVAFGSSDKGCPRSAVFNYQYQSWNEEIDTTFDATAGSQLVKAVSYRKLASDTSLRIKYNALLGVKVTATGNTYCGRWYVSINGTECTPKADIIINHDASNAYNFWRHHVRVYSLEGICDNELEAGQHSIEIYLGKCYWNKTEPTNFIVNSHNSPSRLHIEEVRTEKKVDGVYTRDHSVFRSLTDYLTRYHYYNLDDDTDNGIILSVTYRKQFDETALRLTASGTHALISGAKCARWYFMIDDTDCANPGAIEGISYFSGASLSYQPMQVSGLCSGLSSGAHSISYAVGYCPSHVGANAITGSGASFHVFVEELRLDLVKSCDSNPVQCYGP